MIQASELHFTFILVEVECQRSMAKIQQSTMKMANQLDMIKTFHQLMFKLFLKEKDLECSFEL